MRGGEVERVRRSLFPETIVGLSFAEEHLIAVQAIAARRGVPGHSIDGIARMLDGMTSAVELMPTSLTRELVDGVMARIRDHVRGG